MISSALAARMQPPDIADDTRADKLSTSNRGEVLQPDFLKIAGRPMFATEREQHIQDCGRLMREAYDRWDETGDFQFRGEADMWRRLMEEAIKTRPYSEVRAMEIERGLI